MFMRHITLSLLSFSTVTLLAQPTITSNDVPAIGQQFTYVGDATYVTLPGAGSDQTWDFSASGGTVGNTLNAIAASSAMGAAAFPTANIALATAGFEEFIGITADGLEHFGQYTTSDNIVYTNPELYLPIPCVYGQSWNDDFAGWWGGGSNTFTGNTTAFTGGFGTLILPWGTLTNVLRADMTQTRDESNGFSYVRTTNVFYRPGTGYFVANNEVLELYFGTTLISTTEELTYLDASSIGLQENTANAIGVELMPVPAKDLVTVVFGAAGAMQLRLLDGAGRLVMDVPMGAFAPGIHRHELDIRSLPTGIYSVQVTNAGGERGTRKLVVE